MQTYGKWLLFAPLKETMERSTSVETFFANASLCLGRDIKDFKEFHDECYMYRRFGDWKLLVCEFALSITQELLQQIIRLSEARSAVLSACVFADCAKDKLNPSDRYYYTFFSNLTWGIKERFAGNDNFLRDMMQNKPHGRLRPVRKRALALMYVCKKYGLGRDMRNLLCYVLNNLEVDYMVIHDLVRKERKKYALQYVKKYGIHKLQKHMIRYAVVNGYVYFLPWVLRRCGLPWKWTRVQEELICMNMETCFIPNKERIFKTTWLFDPSEKYDVPKWSPLMLDIARQKLEWIKENGRK